MTANQLREVVITATRQMLDAHDLLVLTNAQQEILRALNRAVLKDDIIGAWHAELPEDMKGEDR